MENTTLIEELKEIISRHDVFLKKYNPIAAAMDNESQREINKLSEISREMEEKRGRDEDSVWRKYATESNKLRKENNKRKEGVRKQICGSYTPLDSGVYDACVLHLNALMDSELKKDLDKDRELYIKYFDICVDADMKPKKDLHTKYLYLFKNSHWYFESEAYDIMIISKDDEGIAAHIYDNEDGDRLIMELESEHGIADFKNWLSENIKK